MDPKEIQRNLDAFERDPRTMMGRIPEKRDRQGAVIKPPTAFSEDDRKSLDFVLAKDAVRRHNAVGAHGYRRRTSSRP